MTCGRHAAGANLKQLRSGAVSQNDSKSRFQFRPKLLDTLPGYPRANLLADISAGVMVGRVTSIALDPKTFQGVVKMEINKGYEFPKDTSAKILTAGLLGDQYIGFEPGGDPANLVAGDTITQTQSAVVLENLIGQFLFNKAADAGTAAAPAGAKK